MREKFIIVLLILLAIIAMHCSPVSAAYHAKPDITVIQCRLVSRSSTQNNDERIEYREHIIVNGEPFFVLKAITILNPKTRVIHVRLIDKRTGIIKKVWSWAEKNGVPKKGSSRVEFIYEWDFKK